MVIDNSIMPTSQDMPTAYRESGPTVTSNSTTASLPETVEAPGEQYLRLHKELMRMMREDFDPTPAGWEGREWNDNAEDVANAMLRVMFAARPTAAETGVEPLAARQWREAFERSCDDCASLRTQLAEESKEVAGLRNEASTKFKVSDQVQRSKSDYKFPGECRSVFTKKSGVVRYVFEDDRGILFIGNDNDWEHRD